MKCFTGFPFDKSRIGNIKSHYQNNEKQETNIEARRRKAVLCYSCKGLYALSDTVCHIVDEVQLIGFLHNIPRGIA